MNSLVIELFALSKLSPKQSKVPPCRPLPFSKMNDMYTVAGVRWEVRCSGGPSGCSFFHLAVYPRDVQFDTDEERARVKNKVQAYAAELLRAPIQCNTARVVQMQFYEVSPMLCEEQPQNTASGNNEDNTGGE